MTYKRLPPAAKIKTLPPKFSSNAFAWNLDWRSPIGQRVMSEVLILADALGGWDEISPQEQKYVSRVVYLSIKCAEYEQADLQGQPTKMDAGTYSNHVNVLSGILSKLGSQRRAKPTQGIQAYLAKAGRKGAAHE